MASQRLDAVVAGVYKLSRSESKALVEGGKVFIDGRLLDDPSAEIVPDTIVSVRGNGPLPLCRPGAGYTERPHLRYGQDILT